MVDQGTERDLCATPDDFPHSFALKTGLNRPSEEKIVLPCLSHAFDDVEETLATVFRKSRFWQSCSTLSFNDRQRLILNKLLDGFEGKLTSSGWAKLAKCSQDTAFRDIQDLLERGVLRKDPSGGRSTSYHLIERG